MSKKKLATLLETLASQDATAGKLA
jgi:hypothetical protein